MEKLKNAFEKLKESTPSLSEEAKHKKSEIKEVLKAKPINLMILRQYGISEYGLVDQDIRKVAWPLLLNIHEQASLKDVNIIDESSTPKFIIKDSEKAWTKNTKLNDAKMADQIEKDVNRSMNSYGLSFGVTFYRKKLSNIMNALFEANKEWSYYQGFNDICSVFLYVLTEDTGYYASTSISHYFVRDYLRSSFDKGVIPALKLMMKIIHK